jgi:malate dehydrogenase (oxaloacetate-decarboxylating)(NADP+)
MKSEFISEREITELRQAMNGADAFIGLSRGNILSEEDIKVMAPKPIIFALANPTPEIDYKKARKARPDAVIATGRSDIPNQINNVLAFPYLFRGALDTLATSINEEMKIAATKAIARIAHEETPREIEERYGKKLLFGRDYILPKPGDRRLLTEVSSAVAKAAMDSGIARRRIASFKDYANTLLARTDNDNFFALESMRRRTQARCATGRRERKHEA